MTRFFGAAVADAGFAPGPQRRAGVPCPQKAAQIAILSVFGPRKKPVAWPRQLAFDAAFQPVLVVLLVAHQQPLADCTG